MQMKLGKLLAETKTGEKRQIEPEKDGRGQKYEFELAGYHFFVRDMVKKTEESDKENQEYFITRRIVGKRKEASGKILHKGVICKSRGKYISLLYGGSPDRSDAAFI